MSRKRGFCLLDGNAMPLLLLRTRFNPTLNIHRVAWVEVELAARVIEHGPQHADITIDSPSREVARAAAIMKTGLPEPLALEHMHLSAASLAPVMQEAQHVQRRGVGERRTRGILRRTDGTDSQKALEISTKTVLLFRVLRVTYVRTQSRKSLVKIAPLKEREEKDNNNNDNDTQEGPSGQLQESNRTRT